MKTRKKLSVPKAVLSIRERKENAIIEAALKQLDTKHLTEFIFSVMREQLKQLSQTAFERSYQNATAIRGRDPEIFRAHDVGAPISLSLLWIDQPNRLCSEQKRSLQFISAEDSRKDHEDNLFLFAKHAVAN